eukprot:NODE_1876_length_874_cov_1534.235152_g1308_i0.p2 GENE.NODE_1876_length_874_cov_1534.235152_g1308_i0~~NODE_1876_length_874_cov_1534.235152_g1308_i0.p2  ORF type:complete len:148 (+),score=61.38 NODE_1876_length_874_cov_1534.235152_g1308_i0:343-786(+)
MRYRHLTNPKKGPFHYRSPRKMFWRVVRGMLPYRTPRGKEALKRLKMCEGVPPPWVKSKRWCCPQAMRVLRLAPDRDWCVLGDVANECGWKNQKIVEELEGKRKRLTHKWWEKKTELTKIHKMATKVVDKIIPKMSLVDNTIELGKL